MQDRSFEQALESLRAKDPRYQRDAYLFLREALDHTQRTTGRDSRGRIRHVTGQELLEGIREYALSQYGPMTKMVLEEWGIFRCQDFGELVFNLVDIGVLSKTENDCRADFERGYDFQEAFQRPFLPPSRQRRIKAVAPKATQA